ncbi:MAG: hypothetical protein OK456_01995 [Thaumarchaeota archaeon]|nr:hypothetical protein [Nitrososphaerota archaeon]
MISRVALVAAVIAVALLGAAYLPGVVSPATSSTGSTTVTQTTATSCTTSTVSSSSTTSMTSANSTTSTVSSSTTSSNVTSGSFTYSPAGPVKIDSVQATTAQEDGVTRVTFQVLFENTGTSPIYVLAGCSGGLSSSIPANSSVIKQTTGGPLCDCAAVILALDDGQNHTSISPGCWSGYYYDLVGSGTVEANFTLNWSADQQDAVSGTNSTTIYAHFTFG